MVEFLHLRVGRVLALRDIRSGTPDEANGIRRATADRHSSVTMQRTAPGLRGRLAAWAAANGAEVVAAAQAHVARLMGDPLPA